MISSLHYDCSLLWSLFPHVCLWNWSLGETVAVSLVIRVVYLTEGHQWCQMCILYDLLEEFLCFIYNDFSSFLISLHKLTRVTVPDSFPCKCVSVSWWITFMTIKNGTHYAYFRQTTWLKWCFTNWFPCHRASNWLPGRHESMLKQTQKHCIMLENSHQLNENVIYSKRVKRYKNIWMIRQALRNKCLTATRPQLLRLHT